MTVLLHFIDVVFRFFISFLEELPANGLV